MNLDPVEKNTLPHIGSDEIIDTFSNAQYAHKKIMIFEAIVLMTVDGVYDEEEQKFANVFAHKIGMKQEDLEHITGLVVKYINCGSDIANALLL